MYFCHSDGSHITHAVPCTVECRNCDDELVATCYEDDDPAQWDNWSVEDRFLLGGDNGLMGKMVAAAWVAAHLVDSVEPIE